MRVRFTPEAEKQADESDAWWREHRDVRDLFARELAATMAMLVTSPKTGTVYTVLDDQPVRKVFMPKTQNYVYYTVDTESGVILIHAVWGAPRGRGPNL